MNKRLLILPSLGALALSGCKPSASTADPAVTPPTATAEPSVAPTDPRTADITARVRKIVATQLKLPLERVQFVSTWKQLGADSLDTVELVMAFEEEFHVEIPDAQAEAMTTVGAAISFLVQHGKK
jgi:acyl carrier protein